MNTENDPLEAELAALRPCEPSPELHQRIAERLTETVQPRPLSQRESGESRPWIVALLAIAAAVVVAAAIFLPRRDDHEVIEPAAAPRPPLASALDESLPSMWQYRAAIYRTPNEIEAVLDKHAARTFEPNPDRARAYVFSRLDSELDSLGEL